jgi:hypothetical protein
MSDVEAPDRPRAVRFRAVAWVFAATIALGVVVALLLHRSFVGAERVAARHLTPDSSAVLRLDLEKVVLFAPVRRVVLPLLNESALPHGKALKPRVHRIGEQSKLLLGRDTRELLVNFGPGAGDWSVIAAGNYPANLQSVLAAVLAEEGAPWKEQGGALVSPQGPALAQASDRALVLGSSSQIVERALPASDAHERFGIPLRGALAFVGDPRKTGWLAAASQSLGELERIEARAEWSSPLEVEWTLTYVDAPPGDLESRVNEALNHFLGEGEAARLERAVGKPRFSRSGRVVHLSTRWDHESLEIVADRVAYRLKDRRTTALGH